MAILSDFLANLQTQLSRQPNFQSQYMPQLQAQLGQNMRLPSFGGANPPPGVSQPFQQSLTQQASQAFTPQPAQRLPYRPMQQFAPQPMQQQLAQRPYQQFTPQPGRQALPSQQPQRFTPNPLQRLPQGGQQQYTPQPRRPLAGYSYRAPRPTYTSPPWNPGISQRPNQGGYNGTPQIVDDGGMYPGGLSRLPYVNGSASSIR